MEEKKITLIGRNLGGAMAAYFLSKEAEQKGALVITGSVPDASNFWIHSMHPQAQAARQQGKFDAAYYVQKMHDTDLIETLPLVTVPTLIQIGSKDNWLEQPSIDRLQQVIKGKQEIRSYYDDHAMSNETTWQDALNFLEEKPNNR